MGDRHLSLDRGPASRQDTSNESLAGHRNSQLGGGGGNPGSAKGNGHPVQHDCFHLACGQYWCSFQTRQCNKVIKEASQAEYLLQALPPRTCSLLMPAVLKVRENSGILWWATGHLCLVYKLSHLAPGAGIFLTCKLRQPHSIRALKAAVSTS